MMFAFAWIAGESILIYRWVKAGAPPTPGAILLPSALFLGLAVVAEYQPARTAATVFAWGLDLAILLQVLGQKKTTITGWPPLMINDATVVMPPGGTTPATAAATSSTGTATGGVQAV